jgi:hypothetical protein
MAEAKLCTNGERLSYYFCLASCRFLANSAWPPSKGMKQQRARLFEISAAVTSFRNGESTLRWLLFGTRIAKVMRDNGNLRLCALGVAPSRDPRWYLGCSRLRRTVGWSTYKRCRGAERRLFRWICRPHFFPFKNPSFYSFSKTTTHFSIRQRF